MSDPERVIEEARRLLEGITPGEWAVRDMDEGELFVVLDDNEPGMCVLAAIEEQSESVGNAAFIAAAPRLLRALLSALDARDEREADLHDLITDLWSVADPDGDKELKARVGLVLGMNAPDGHCGNPICAERSAVAAQQEQNPLREFAQHLPDCDTQAGTWMVMRPHGKECTCGLEAALTSTPPVPQEQKGGDANERRAMHMSRTDDRNQSMPPSQVTTGGSHPVEQHAQDWPAVAEYHRREREKCRK